MPKKARFFQLISSKSDPFLRLARVLANVSIVDSVKAPANERSQGKPFTISRFDYYEGEDGKWEFSS